MYVRKVIQRYRDRKTDSLSRTFDIILTVYHDKLYNETNEMHFLEFYSDNIFYMFRIGKLFISRRQFYCACSLWYASS